jgi:hypothetical protein
MEGELCHLESKDVSNRWKETGGPGRGPARDTLPGTDSPGLAEVCFSLPMPFGRRDTVNTVERWGSECSLMSAVLRLRMAWMFPEHARRR